jgi:hypothetical protein
MKTWTHKEEPLLVLCIGHHDACLLRQNILIASHGQSQLLTGFCVMSIYSQQRENEEDQKHK